MRTVLVTLLLTACARNGSPLPSLATHLEEGGSVQDAGTQPWATTPMSEEDAAEATLLVHQALIAELADERSAELDAEALEYDGYTMPLWWTTRGDAAFGERSLYISMHGGGNAPPEVNDQQWRNQQQLYAPEEGVYVAPRAPTDEWNLWHRPEIDVFIDRIIEDMVAVHGVDPNRVYLTGYSAGGDGAYQLAWHLADRFAGANPNAGHPNDASPLSMRNLPVTIHVGGDDSAYDRNRVGAQWGERLDELQAEDPGGYVHEVVVHPGLPHWMNGEEAVALPWMAAHERRTSPDRVVWQVRGGRSGERLYWLGLDDPEAHSGALLTAEVQGDTIAVTTESETPVTGLRLWLDDDVVDLSKLKTCTDCPYVGRLSYGYKNARPEEGLH